MSFCPCATLAWRPVPGLQKNNGKKQTHDDILDATKDYSGERCADADNADILRALNV